MPHFDILDVGQVYISNAYKIVQIHNWNQLQPWISFRMEADA